MDRSKHWGDLESDEEEEEASEEEEEEEAMDEEQMQAGMASVDTVSTTPAGLETPDLINLRKGQPEKPLYQVLEQREGRVEEGQLMGSSHTYAVPGAKKVRRFWMNLRWPVCLEDMLFRFSPFSRLVPGCAAKGSEGCGWAAHGRFAHGDCAKKVMLHGLSFVAGWLVHCFRVGAGLDFLGGHRDMEGKR